MATFGVYGAIEEMPVDAMTERLQSLEELGYDSFWVGENIGMDAFVQLAFAASVTTRLRFGTAIVPIWSRTAATMRASSRALADLSGDRFTLGVGASHPAFAEQTWGVRPDAPVTRMREYLARYAEAAQEGDRRVPLYIAALRPRMLELAAEHADGVLPYLVTPERIAEMRSVVGTSTKIVAALAVSVDDDRRVALRRAREYLGVYREADVYRTSLFACGFGPDDLDPEPSERLVHAIVALGSAAEVTERLREFVEAGADQLNLMMLDGDPWYEPHPPTLAALAPLLLR